MDSRIFEFEAVFNQIRKDIPTIPSDENLGAITTLVARNGYSIGKRTAAALSYAVFHGRTAASLLEKMPEQLWPVRI